MADMCGVSISCPCNTTAQNGIVRVGEKTFFDIFQEIKKCNCKIETVSGRVTRTDAWTNLASDVVSTTAKELGASVSAVMAAFDLKYFMFNCAREPDSASADDDNFERPHSAFDVLFRAQQHKHLPPAKVAQNRKDELYNDILDRLRALGVGFSVPASREQGSQLLTVSNTILHFANPCFNMMVFVRA